MEDKVLRVRDGITGAAVLGSVVLGFKINALWFLLTGLIGALLVLSAGFGVCFLYSFLGQCRMRKNPPQ